jgi:predicted PurR-regulated permease PerM
VPFLSPSCYNILMQKPHISELVFFWIVFAIVGILSYFIFAPYFTIIFLSVVLAIILNSPYKWFLNKFNGREGLAAGAVTFIAVIAILIPAFILGSLLTTEVVNTYNLITQSGTGGVVKATLAVNSVLHRMIPSSLFEINLSSFAETFLQYLTVNINKFFISVASVVFDVMLLVISLYFFIKDGDRLKTFIMKWSPLPIGYNKSILDRLGTAISAVVKGTVVVALVQGVITGIGLAIFGVPSSLLLGVIATFTALIPVVGTGLVSLPAVIYLLATGSYISAVALALWSIILVGNLDTLIRPLMLKKDLKLHPFVIILSVIGGLAFFGPIGFVAGPIVVALFFVLLDIYPEIIKGREVSPTSELLENVERKY